MKIILWCICLLCLFNAPTMAAERPNVLLIVADDLGYADVGFNGCQDIPTPNLDRLAARGVRCTNGYVTHPFCSPSRAALLTGRYQHRFGHENNPGWLPENATVGLPVAEVTLPQVLKQVNYRTAAIGKWHLGAHPLFHPNQRGFEHYFGMLGGGHSYLPDLPGDVEYSLPMDRDGTAEPLAKFITNVLGEEAAVAIGERTAKPWFMYLAFNAPHTPLQATEQHLERVAHIADSKRRKYAGLVIGLDDAIGEVLSAVERSGQESNTLIWFFSDNGGPLATTNCDNAPLRGGKGELYEGGVRVPFLVSWPGHLPASKVYEKPVSSLDVFATAAALADAEVPATHQLEGVNVIPFLSGENKAEPHEQLFWRTYGGVSFAVREGDWKLIGGNAIPTQLFNLREDIAESQDLAVQQPQVLSRLKLAYEEWNKHNIAAVFPGAKGSQAKQAAAKAAAKAAARKAAAKKAAPTPQ